MFQGEGPVDPGWSVLCTSVFDARARPQELRPSFNVARLGIPASAAFTGEQGPLCGVRVLD